MATDYRNTEIPPSTSSFGTPGALVYELFTVRHCAGCRPNFLIPTPPSPSHPPALQPPMALPIFSRSSAVGSRSRIKPLIEMRLEALEHLFFYVFDVGEQVPTSDIAVFTGALKLQNEFFH